MRRQKDQPDMNTETGTSYLVITASGVDRTGIVDQLAGRIADCGCNIEESRMTMLENHFALLMLVSGPWHALAKLEGQMIPLGEQLGLTILHERARKHERAEPVIPYTVEIVAMDQPGIVRSLSAFFSRKSINIEELQSSSYPAPHSGTPLFSVVMTVGIQARVHIPTLRNEFLDYCDDLNLDATFEPVRR
jgi:glycine cleavage system transcriptional repressor